MKTLIFLLISFSTFAQIDTIQPPCDLNRQQTRLWYKAIEDVHDLKRDLAKYADDQHKREIDKEVKELRYGLKTERLQRRKDNDWYSFQIDSLKRSNALELKTERIKCRIISDSLTLQKRLNKSNERVLKKEISKDKAKIRTFQYLILFVGLTCILLIILLILKIKH